MRRTLIVPLLVCLVCSCASAPPPPPLVHVEIDIEPSEYLLRWAGEWQPEVAQPVEDSVTLKAAIRRLRGAERHAATLRYVAALIYEAEEAEEDDELRHARREIRRAVRSLRRVRGEHAATRDFLEVVAAWLGGLPRAIRLAERFTSQHEDATLLHQLAWMILGELYFEAERWPDAATSYRFLLGDLEHPLYAFASWRTAAVLRAQGRAEEADAMLPQIVRLACSADTPEPTDEIATAAASEANISRRGDRFEVCEGGEREQERNMEDELPPGYR